MKPMLIISYDALGDKDFDILLKYPAFSKLAQQSTVFRNVPSIFVSNTYPIHTSVATGVLPCVHGIISNTEPYPVKSPVWNSSERDIKVKTLWQTAAGQGIKVAAVFWPVTGFSKSIRYNVPEVPARPGKNQVITSLKAGNAWLQFKLLLRYGKLLNGINQPNLDNFAAASMAYILRKHNPGLALVHLTAYDSLCHKHGKGSPGLDAAFEAMDNNLAALLDAAGDERDIILFSDHSQINVHTYSDPNELIAEMGLLHESYAKGSADGHADGRYASVHSDWHRCFFECCGGCAFFHGGSLSDEAVGSVRNRIELSDGFFRFLSPDEMQDSGYSHASFGFCAKAGYCYGMADSTSKANHGYTLDMPDYTVFYMIKGSGITQEPDKPGSLLDIAPLAARLLGLSRGKQGDGSCA